jgi:hypothetical protein
MLSKMWSISERYSRKMRHLLKIRLHVYSIGYLGEITGLFKYFPDISDRVIYSFVLCVLYTYECQIFLWSRSSCWEQRWIGWLWPTCFLFVPESIQPARRRIVRGNFLNQHLIVIRHSWIVFLITREPNELGMWTSYSIVCEGLRQTNLPGKSP